MLFLNIILLFIFIIIFKNWRKLDPSPSRHISVLLQSGIHTEFAPG